MTKEQERWVSDYMQWAMSDRRTSEMAEAELRSGIVAAWIVPLSGIED